MADENASKRRDDSAASSDPLIPTENPTAKSVTPTENPTAKPGEDDQELDDLLDSALKDFDKPATGASPQACTSPTEPNLQTVLQDAASASIPPSTGNQESLFEDLFSNGVPSGDVQQQFEACIQDMLGDQPNLAQQLENLSRLAGESDNTEESQKAFADSLQQTLNSLSQNADSIEADFSEEDLMKAMSGMALGESEIGEGDAGLLNMMQGMMKSLLSKDVLYPSLKEITEKYPAWLEENKGKEPEESYNKYQRQYELMQQVVEEFEADSDSDSEAVKKERFERVLDIMQKMQDCGQPPKDIVGDMMPGLEFDENGEPQMPNIPGMNQEQCSLM